LVNLLTDKLFFQKRNFAMATRLIIFLILNFAALGLGGLSTGSGVSSEWYQTLAKAPWTPPGWVFGAAWTTIMICFAIYMAFAWDKIANKKYLIALFAGQWILNVIWNPIFFKCNEVLGGLFIITALTVLMGFILFSQWSNLKLKSLLLLPYFIWLLIATSLNAFILFNN
jgi:tryptophan-rich sensory protein